MLKRLVNEAHFTLAITTTGPVLVRSGHATLSGPDLTPVVTFRDGDWQVYLPGSSLKGVMRSHLEKVCRTLRPQPPVVCNPFWTLANKAKATNGRLVCPEYAEVSCGDKFERRAKEEFSLQPQTWRHGEEEITSEIAYHDSCPICRLFGSTGFIGRVSINDAYLTNWTRRNPVESRDGVGIDRLTGGSFKGALFNLEAVSPGVEFQTEIRLRNFEGWQLGMLLLAVQDMEDGLVRIGSGRSRGFGSVTASVSEVTINHLGRPKSKPPSQVWGLGRFLEEMNDDAYGTWPDDVLHLEHAPDEKERGIRLQAIFGDQSLADLTQQAMGAFLARMAEWPVREEMQFDHLGFA